ncbi:MAG: VOC family protein [Proteobacteria bacterium]|nr:VOC family protein [Pseudomonadota bacterium]
MSDVQRFSHLGVCVSDATLSTRFYVDGLGFEADAPIPIGSDYARLMGLDEVDLQSIFLRRPDVTVELLAFQKPEARGDRRPRPVHHFGLTHLSFRVADVDRVAKRLQELGGQVLTDTRTTFGDGEGLLDFLYYTDPDGTRIELMRLPGP